MQPEVTRPFVFDTHVDSIQRQLDLGQDLGVRGPGMLDLVRGREGGLGAVVLASWCEPHWIQAGDPGSESVPPDWNTPPATHGGAYTRTMALVREARALAAKHPKLARWVRDASDFDAARAAGQIATLIGIEGGHSIESSLANLDAFHAAGVRLLTLVWNNHLPWIRSCQMVPDSLPFDVPNEAAGMSDFGLAVIDRLNALGMVVDISHACDGAARTAMRRSSAPVIASHSGCRALSDHPRNLTDALLRELSDSGGVVGIVFHASFLDDQARAADRRIYANPDYRALKGAHPTETWMLQSAYHQAHVAPLSLERVVDHICHAVDVAGSEHVGLGSDFDGIPRCPTGLEDAAAYPNLAAALLRRGLTARQVDGVMGANMLSVFKEVTQSASCASV